MKTSRRFVRSFALATILPSLLFSAAAARGQARQEKELSRADLIDAAREIMEAARYSTLITIAPSGQPHARTMDPFPPEPDMVVWLATNPNSRKVREIRRDPRVTLHYSMPEEASYVTITGTARLVDDPAEKARRWKEEWQAFYPDRERSYLLIEVTPRTLEILSYGRGITGNPETWETPSVRFGTPGGRE